MIKYKFTLFFPLLCLVLIFSCKVAKKPTTSDMNSKTFTYLALGDSYTIGEGVDESDRYPNQVVALLKEKAIDFEKPVIIAKTGWTTDELQKGIEAADIQGKTFDLVTLLIGVNNQYRGRPVTNYQVEFKSLLENAIKYAGGDPNRVVVISIPDWGITPFAENRDVDQEKVANEIEKYNSAKKAIAVEKEVHYIDITDSYRSDGNLPEMMVSDQLHPSRLIYRQWSDKISDVILSKMTF